MIARTWRGWTSAADADRHVDYFEVLAAPGEPG
jgi:hypothetical protein